MDFTAIGRLSSYVKTKNLMFAAKYKIRTGQTLTNANGNLVSTGGTVATTFDKLRDAAKAGNDKAKQAKLRRIKNKLLTGKKLSDEELGFLRVNDPKLYKKAKAASSGRNQNRRRGRPLRVQWSRRRRRQWLNCPRSVKAAARHLRAAEAAQSCKRAATRAQ